MTRFFKLLFLLTFFDGNLVTKKPVLTRFFKLLFLLTFFDGNLVMKKTVLNNKNIFWVFMIEEIDTEDLFQDPTSTENQNLDKRDHIVNPLFTH